MATNKRRMVLACLLAPLANRREADAQDLHLQTTIGVKTLEIQPFGLSIVLQNNGPNTPMLSVEAIGRKVTFTTKEVMDILEGA